jgi:hypothetical protein
VGGADTDVAVVVVLALMHPKPWLGCRVCVLAFKHTFKPELMSGTVSCSLGKVQVLLLVA